VNCRGWREEEGAGVVEYFARDGVERHGVERNQSEQTGRDDDGFVRWIVSDELRDWPHERLENIDSRQGFRNMTTASKLAARLRED
jgi:hypothetical protein